MACLYVGILLGALLFIDRSGRVAVPTEATLLVPSTTSARVSKGFSTGLLVVKYKQVIIIQATAGQEEPHPTLSKSSSPITLAPNRESPTPCLKNRVAMPLSVRKNPCLRLQHHSAASADSHLLRHGAAFADTALPGRCCADSCFAFKHFPEFQALISRYAAC